MTSVWPTLKPVPFSPCILFLKQLQLLNCLLLIRRHPHEAEFLEAPFRKAHVTGFSLAQHEISLLDKRRYVGICRIAHIDAFGNFATGWVVSVLKEKFVDPRQATLLALR